jgi:hypothetical protein
MLVETLGRPTPRRGVESRARSESPQSGASTVRRLSCVVCSSTAKALTGEMTWCASPPRTLGVGSADAHAVSPTVRPVGARLAFGRTRHRRLCCAAARDRTCEPWRRSHPTAGRGPQGFGSRRDDRSRGPAAGGEDEGRTSLTADGVADNQLPVDIEIFRAGGPARLPGRSDLEADLAKLRQFERDTRLS